ncbi:maleylpyruvate isomerase family mycothiol-dependent enzyme [Phytoactinopolyspora alkaliphila]|uniref:Maleylpyruvate isomerase family mycothiol-dependent enzyme n=1 Tax=Phytoactinopolyspora alkaliphila TaxID=1783498 RepID=A0A6N9YMY1_9ACTN|nr:maleylpyruvate isomerase family mycothiol-dependent enzyme [Phytoactinopolyspora alkaliphila]NED96332.1 maleylpyruvate isomerase family mycothiol-dependent enzyme [Phytoactinopolyspora alkaliphila]
MTSTMATPVQHIPKISHREARDLATTEHHRALDLLRSLDDEEWSKPTDCPAWDVRAMAGHMLGMMEFTCSVREFVHVIRAGGKAAGDGPTIDGMTEVQVADRAGLGVDELLERIAAAGPRAARRRYRVPRPLRALPMKQEMPKGVETWRLGYLFDIILTRDPWMHRIDLSRATGRELLLTPEHDGRVVSDVVAEWARRHGQSFTLTLTGPAGGTFTHGNGGEDITIDAVQFCRTVSGRGSGPGLLGEPVPF